MTAHTPGPWWFGIKSWDDDAQDDRPDVKPAGYSGDGYSANPFIYGPDGSQVVGCDEYNVFGEWDPALNHRREADIRLMLSSPELLDALAEMTALAAGPTGGVTADEKRAVIAKARAAIAKATGGDA